MKYFRELEDYTNEELIEEINYREDCLTKNICPYCIQSLEEHTCKYKKRYNEQLENWKWKNILESIKKEGNHA